MGQKFTRISSFNHLLDYEERFVYVHQGKLIKHNITDIITEGIIKPIYLDSENHDRDLIDIRQFGLGVMLATDGFIYRIATRTRHLLYNNFR